MPAIIPSRGEMINETEPNLKGKSPKFSPLKNMMVKNALKIAVSPAAVQVN